MDPFESFVEQIRDVLAHLYDYPWLQTHTLIEEFRPGGQLDPQQRMHFLRTIVLTAIEEMHPSPDAAPSYSDRTYRALELHYVKGLMVQEVARELALSERQAYRVLRKAERELATLLWPRRRVDEQLEKDRGQAEALLAEAELWGSEKEELQVQALLKGALQAVAQLGEEVGVHISLELPTTPLPIKANRLISRQTLVSVLSHAIQHAKPTKEVTVSVERRREGFQLIVGYSGLAQGSEDWEASLAIPEQLAKLQGGEWKVSTNSEGWRQISFTLGGASQTAVLLIDDNEVFIELFRRYLTGRNYGLIAARSGEEGLRLAEEQSPDVILLDVMMPQQDGWEVLQLLRNRRRTRNIPVLVCSVIGDERLALSLGAAGFLAKPVKRGELLNALEDCRLRRTEAPSHPAGPGDNR